MSQRKAKQTIARLSKQFADIGGFDIANCEVTTMSQVLRNAREHVEWYRLHTADMAKEMERIIDELESEANR